MRNDEYVIECDNVYKKYALYQKQRDRLIEALSPRRKAYHTDFYALNGVSFRVKKGECVGIIGKNGSGKSTLLKILTGVLMPTSGRTRINGRVAALLELGAGFNPEYTGYENIYLNGTVMGYSREEMEKKLPEIIEFADIGEFINQPVKIYSSGMFVRLAFAVAISVDPDVLIIDEALAVGDVFFQLKCYKKFEDFKKRGKTIIFVSHDQSSIIKYCDRAILLNEGTVICDTNTKDAIDRYKELLVNASAENVDMNLAEPETHQNTNWKSNYRLNEKTLEYGDKTAEIVDFGIFGIDGKITNTFLRNEEYTIRIKVKFHESVDNPIFAVTFKDFMGLEVAGTNTMQEGIETGTCAKGDLITVSFRAKFPFQNQPYFLSLGCTCFDPAGDLLVLHRLYDVLCVQTIGAKITNGFFDLDATVEITRQ